MIQKSEVTIIKAKKILDCGMNFSFPLINQFQDKLLHCNLFQSHALNGMNLGNYFSMIIENHKSQFSSSELPP